MTFTAIRQRIATSAIPRRVHCSRAVLLAFVLFASGCATRPTNEVLQPSALHSAKAQQVSILTSTNRQLDVKSGDPLDIRSNSLSFEHYSFSVPNERDANDIEYPKTKPDPQRQFVVTQREALNEASFIEEVNNQTNADGTICVFVHGYNFTYPEALFRTAQLAADATELSAPVLFSWPSTASVAGYVADRDSALASRTELAALLATVSKAPKVKHIVLFAHSMGSMLAVEAVRQLRHQGRADLIGKLQIVLAAADIDIDLFQSQLRDIGTMPTPITLLVSREDRALTISSFLGGQRLRVGQVDAADPIVQRAAQAENLRVVDISSLQDTDRLGHNRYASLARRLGNGAAQDFFTQISTAAYAGTFALDRFGNVHRGAY